jgi:hypothetical protein
VTSMQRRACFSLNGLSFGRSGLGVRSFARAMVRRAECVAWKSIELTPRQLERLARAVRRFRRQIGDPNLLFWSQRVLAEQAFSTLSQEEPCP